MTSKEIFRNIVDGLEDLLQSLYNSLLSKERKEQCKQIENDLDKLENLEDIEKELGIDLRVYHKLMEMLYCGEPNIVYVKDKDMVIQVGVLEIDYCKKKIIFYKDKNYNEDYIYGFWQYGKTWALTEEELEDEE